jgi:xanthine/CO dehydrogenase XdhC/CoxF family maturation factor
MKLETLKDSKGPQVGVTNRERRPERLKYRVIAKAPKFGWKCNGRMTTRFHFQKARTAAGATPGVTAVFGEE